MSGGRTAGLLVVDKPTGLTSHDVVERVRRILHERVGHAGTLDPQATGVLLLCIGPATRLARFLQGHHKVYEGVVRLGWATDTYDAQGERVGEAVTVPALESAAVSRALAGFAGEQQQLPPVYSAKKVRGQPAYRRARRGEPVQPRPVTVTVYALELLALAGDEIHIRVRCSAGTYVRSLAHDLGGALACPAHLAALRRTGSGVFELRQALAWSEIEHGTPESLRERILPPAEMLPDWPAAVVDGSGSAAVSDGGMVEAGWIVERRPGAPQPAPHTGGPPDGWVRLMDREGGMIAVGEMVPGGLVQPRVVLR